MSPFPSVLRVLASALLLLHPPDFRREWRAEYRRAVAHRWRLEVERGRRGARTRVALVLLTDALSSLPREWWDALAGGPDRRRAPGSTADAPRRPGSGVGVADWLNGWLRDLRVAARSLARRLGFSTLVVLTLALGIGANASIFGVLDQVILRPFPFEGGDRAVYIMDHSPARGFTFSPTQAEYERWKEGARTLEALEALQAGAATLTGRGPATVVERTFVSLGLPAMVGARPVLGRSFAPDDAAPGAPPVVMVDEDHWRSAWGADPYVVGSTVTLSDEEHTVIGVWPSDARIQVDGDPDFFGVLPPGEELDRSSFSILLGRMVEGVGLDEVEAELAALQSTLEEDPGASSSSKMVPRVMAPYSFLGDAFVSGLWILFAGAGLLLAIAAVNASNLLLGRAVDREAELGVRMALGGSPGRLLRRFLLESVLLAGAGAVLGMALASLGGTVLARLAPSDVPAAAFTDFGAAVPHYTLLLVAAVAVTCAAVPALHLRSSRVRSLLSTRDASSSGSRSRLRSGLVAVQVALAVVLVIGSGLTLRSLQRLTSIDPGFAADEVAILTVRVPERRYPTETERSAFYDRVAESLEGMPDVRSSSASWVIPLSYSIRSGEAYLDGEEAPDGEGVFLSTGGIAPGFLETLDIPLLEGRDFTPEERAAPGESGVAIVNRAFAARYPGSVVGRELRFTSAGPEEELRRIVGVVGDVRAHSLTDEPGRVQVYYPEQGGGDRSAQRFLVRAAGEASALIPLVRSRIAALDPQVAVTGARTGREMIRAATEDERFLALLLAVLGTLSLLLAVGGVYGAVSLHVSRRTRELGIRVALGAGTERLVRDVVARGLRPVVLGILFGAGGALLLVRFVGGVLYETSAVDPVAFVGASLLLIAAAVAAALLPARRVTRVAPVEALRAE